MNFLHTLFYFVIAIGILVAVHELGHFWVARRAGVKVLRFSIGFGNVLWRYQKNPLDRIRFIGYSIRRLRQNG